MLNDGLDFSFSGLKTSVVNYVRKNPDVSAADVAASFQAAVVDVLVAKARRAAASVGARGLVLGGGVAANSLLRERFADAGEEDGDPGLPAQPGDVHRQRGDDRRRRLAPPRQRRRRPRSTSAPSPTCASPSPTRRRLRPASGPQTSNGS